MARSKGVGVSLFSFQDIITSVTAVVILLLLLLTVEKLLKKFDTAALDVIRNQEELMAAEDQMTDLAKSLEMEIRAVESTSPQLTRPTKVELQRKLSALQSRRMRVNQEQADASQILIAAERLKTDVLSETYARQADVAYIEKLEQETASKGKELERLKQANKAAVKALAELEKQISTDRAIAMTHIFNKPENTAKQPWILDVFADGLACLKIGSGAVKNLSIKSNGDNSDFDNWLRALSVSQNYILVMIRPSGVRHLPWVVGGINDAGIPMGIDLLGEGQQVLDGSTMSR